MSKMLTRYLEASIGKDLKQKMVFLGGPRQVGKTTLAQRAAKIRAVKKEQKLYMWDWSQVQNPGARFENMVASHLLKFCHYQEDVEGYQMELRFLRDTDKREVDFVMMKEKKPLFAVECKTGDRVVSPHLHYYHDRTSIPHFYQVHLGTTHKQVSDRISLMPFESFCKEVKLV